MESIWNGLVHASQITCMGRWKRSPPNGPLSGVKANNSHFHIMNRRVFFPPSQKARVLTWKSYIIQPAAFANQIEYVCWYSTFLFAIWVLDSVQSNDGSSHSLGKSNWNALAKCHVQRIMRLCFAPKKSETAETIGCMEVYCVSNKLTILHSFKEIAVVLFSEECFHEEHRKKCFFFLFNIITLFGA